MSEPSSTLMRRDKIDHILRAAGRITGLSEFVLIGSAAIFAWRDLVPAELAVSRDIDLFAYDAPNAEDVSDQLDGAIGQASDFDLQFGYYCDGVGPETAILPNDWRDRARKYQSTQAEGVTAIVPDPNDIGLSKLCAWREKDIEWLRVAARHLIIDPAVMRERLQQMPERAGDVAGLARRLDALL